MVLCVYMDGVVAGVWVVVVLAGFREAATRVLAGLHITKCWC